MDKKEFIKELKNRGISGGKTRKQAKISIAMYGSYEAALEAVDGMLKAAGEMTKQFASMINTEDWK